MTKSANIERKFVYQGIRVDDTQNRFVCLSLIESDNSLSKPCYFKYKKSLDRVIGQIYVCEFTADSKSAVGLDSAKWCGQWECKEDSIKWMAQQHSDETEYKRKKMEKEKGKVSEIEKAMLPVRQLYSKMYQSCDINSCAALESLVVSILRKRIRTIEK